MDTLLFDVSNRVATVTLNNPPKRNPLGGAMVRELVDVFHHCDQDSEVHAVLLRGAGESFCAGADLAEFSASLDAGAVEHWNSGAAWGELFKLVPGMSKPVVAAVHGYALAGGLGLVALCDLAIAAESAKFGTPEVNIGLFPLFILPALIRAVGRRHAADLSLTGRTIDAEEARTIGLVTRVVPDRDLASAAREMAEDLAAKPAQTMRMGKHAFHRMAELDYEAALDFARALRGSFLGGEELRHGTSRFLNKKGS